MAYDPRYKPTAAVALALFGAGLVAGCEAPAAIEAPPRPNVEAAVETAPALAAGEGRVRAILNAGVMGEVALAGDPVKFLFDPLYDDHFGSFEELPEALIEAIVTGEPPYDGVRLVFVSHAHGDHFSARHLARMMAAQPELRLVAPAQAVARLAEATAWQPAFEERVIAIALENGEQSESLSLAGAEIEALRSPHNGWPEDHSNVHNLTYRVSVPVDQGRALRVMHLGDADPAPEHFEPHKAFLSRVRTGLVIVPYWFAGEGVTMRERREPLNADGAVAMHVPRVAQDWLVRSGWDYFHAEGESLPVPATRNPAPSE